MIAADKPSLENDTEGAISNNLAISVGDFLLVARLSVGSYDFDDFVRVIDCFDVKGVRWMIGG